MLSLRQSEREHLLELVRDPAGDRSAGRSHTLGIVVTTHREDQLQRQRLVETQTILCSFDVFLGIWQVNGAQRLVQTDESVLGPSLGGQRLLDRIELVEHLPHAPHDGPALDLAGRRVQRDQCAVEDGQIEFGAGILICASQARKVTGSLDGCKRNYRILFADTRFRENQVARMSERPLAAEVLHRPGEHRPNAGLDDVPHLLRVEERDVHGLRISRQRYSQHLPRTVLHLHDGSRRHPRDDGDVLTLGRLLLGKFLACRRVPVRVVTQQVLDRPNLECLVERVRGLLSQQPIEWVGERRHQFLQHSVAVSTCVRISAVTDRPGSITPRPTGTGHPADHPDRRARRRPGGARRRAPRAARPGRPARLRP